MLGAIIACSPSNTPDKILPVNKAATPETVALYNNLFRLAEKGFMFGHEDDQAYGIGWWAEPGRSDVKEVTGSYPAVHGWDVGKIGTEMNLDSVRFDDMINWIAQTYERGGLNTISWHMDNLVSGGSTWEKTPTVKAILPGGDAHNLYLDKLQALTEFFRQCKSGDTPVPIVFRPFHEHNGDWFWWGKGISEEEDYIALWRFTADYFKAQGIHQLLYAFSPDRSRMNLENAHEDYFYGYPGDEYVDIIGLDNYWDVGHGSNKKSLEESREDLIKSLQLITNIAKEKGKVAALTETGSNGIQPDDWFTRVLLEPIRENDETIDIAWTLVWRNRFEDHAYAPYPGHPSAGDFIRFRNDPLTIFEADLQNLYVEGKPLLRSAASSGSQAAMK